MLNLSFLILFGLGVASVSGYDPAAEQIKRLEILEKTCKKYDDDLTYEYPVLFGTDLDPAAYTYGNLEKKFRVCVPPRSSAESWLTLMIRIHLNDKLTMSEEEIEALKTVDYAKSFTESHKSIVVRHPLENVLSAYRSTLKDTVLMVDINKKILEFWLEKRQDKLTPEPDEEVVLTIAHQNETFLSFRQFVNFLIKCSEEEPACVDWTNMGAPKQWTPFWLACSNLCHYKPDSIIHLSHVQEDKEFVFNLVGLNNSIPLENHNSYGEDHHTPKEIIKQYYSRLLKSEIYDLYLKYKLDHELFGFTPDEFIAMGRDEIMTSASV